MKLASYLRYLMDSGRYRLVDLARATGIPASDLSNVAHDRRLCGARNLVKLAKGVEDEHRTSVVSFWVMDQIPDELADLVHVIKATPGDVKPGDEMPPDVNTLEGALEVLKEEGERNAAILRVLTNLASAFVKS